MLREVYETILKYLCYSLMLNLTVFPDDKIAHKIKEVNYSSMNTLPTVVVFGDSSPYYRNFLDTSNITKIDGRLTKSTTDHVLSSPNQYRYCPGKGYSRKKVINTVITGKTPATLWIVLDDAELFTQIITRVMMLKTLSSHQFSFIPNTTTTIATSHRATTHPDLRTTQNSHNPTKIDQEVRRHVDRNSQKQIQPQWIAPFYCSDINIAHISSTDEFSTLLNSCIKTPSSMPIIRDESGHILLGTARIYSPTGETVPGEAYIDEKRIADPLREIEIAPLMTLPGLQARTKTKRRFLPGYTWSSWYTGRAAQAGGTGFTVAFPDGTTYERTLTTFYRHDEMMQIVHLSDNNSSS